MPSIARRGPKPERAQLRALKNCILYSQSRATQGRATLRFPPASLRKASRSLAIFNSIFFLFRFPNYRDFTPSCPLSSACWMVRVGGIGQSKPKPVHKRAERFTQSCWTEPSGAFMGLCKRQSCTVTGSWICLHPGPSCFRVGSMFSGVPIHRIAGAFEPNRALVTVASREAR